MELDLTAREDFGHRLLHWAERFKYPIIFTLVGAIVLSLFLAGLTHWISVREGKAEVALFEAHGKPEALEKVVQHFPRSGAALLALVDLGAADLAANNFDACIRHYDQTYTKAGRLAFFRVMALQGKGV